MTTALQPVFHPAMTPAMDRPIRPLPVPWRDPHTVSPADLKTYIGYLETKCLEHPNSADFRTCLGVAHAMNLDVYRAMDSLEESVALDPTHFFAQLKYAELLYRLRTLERAEEEAVKALNLAGNGWELSMARTLLQNIRQKRRDGSQKPEWNKPLRAPLLALLALLAITSLAMVLWK